MSLATLHPGETVVPRATAKAISDAAHGIKRVYGAITKVNEDERTVEGVVSTESEDAQGEIVTKEAMTKAIPDFMKLPGGGNLREMHQPSAVGKIPQIFPPSKDGTTKVVARVVDDTAWAKVKESVYTGFSIGGRVLKQIGNKIMDLELSEISLVDRPANPDAYFTLVKMDTNYMEKGMMEAVSLGDIVLTLDAFTEIFRSQGKKTKLLERAADALREVVTTEAAEKLDSALLQKLKFNLLNLIQMKKLEKTEEATVDEVKEVVEEVNEELEAATEEEKEQVAEASEQEEEKEEEEAEEKEEVTEEAEKMTKMLTKLDAKLEELPSKSDIAKLATVDAVSALEERMAKIEQTVVKKGYASYAEVGRFEKKGDADMAKSKARYEELKKKVIAGTHTNEEHDEVLKLYDVVFRGR